LERATKLKAKNNLDGSPNKGNLPLQSNLISDLSSSVGISLGSSFLSVLGAIHSSGASASLESGGYDHVADLSDSDNDWEEHLLSVNLPVESDDDCIIEELVIGYKRA